jgi:copper chaperone CopZ/uncharacterized membrane protein YeaQ/YmgE (transglycosylase-associated protein family)
MNKKKELIKKTKIYIKGMTCASCVKKIETSLLENKTILNVEINLEKRFALIYHNEKFIKNDAINKINSLGYKVSNDALKQGLIYGLVPHIGCISFIIAAIIGATALTQFFKPLLMNRYFFHILILISFLFATISAIIYLNKNGSLNLKGIKDYKKYLFTMYSVTIFVNLALFLFIFPLTANLTTASNNNIEGLTEMSIVVNIPCSGHAPLITSELIKLEGVENVRYVFPFGFKIGYDENQISQNEILAIEVFEEYPARLN